MVMAKFPSKRHALFGAKQGMCVLFLGALWCSSGVVRSTIGLIPALGSHTNARPRLSHGLP